MPKTILRENKRNGYINVGITSTLHAQCQLAANERGEALHDFVAIALQQRLHSQRKEKREMLYRDACIRAEQQLRPCPRRDEFYIMNGWTE